MTEEEKAEELTTELICGKCKEIKHCKIIGNDKCINYIRSLNAILQGYKKGLAEGRKEGYEQGKNNERESQCGKKNYEKDIAKLEKENEKLKALIDQLSNDNHVLKTSFIVQQEQIEKEHELLNDIIEAFTSQSLTDDDEMAYTARKIAGILEIKNYR